MILDKGICSIFSTENVGEPGNMSILQYTLRHQSWYGELNHETSPVRPTDGREDVEIAMRVRVHQNHLITNKDVLCIGCYNHMPENSVCDAIFEVMRAYHGIDTENGQPITDLTLRRVQA